MKRLIVITCVLSIFACLGACSFSSTSSSNNSSASTANAEAKEMTADEFTAKFADNADATEKEFEGKTFIITGEYVGELFKKTIQVDTTIEYDNYSDCELRFDISSEEFEKIGEISKGDTITLKAQFKDVMSYTLELENTEFISKENAEPTTEKNTDAPTEPTTEAPTPEPTEPPVVETEPTTHKYMINTDSGKFHFSSCHTIKDSANVTEYYGTAEELKEQGYSSCGICEPR